MCCLSLWMFLRCCVVWCVVCVVGWDCWAGGNGGLGWVVSVLLRWGVIVGGLGGWGGDEHAYSDPVSAGGARSGAEPGARAELRGRSEHRAPHRAAGRGGAR